MKKIILTLTLFICTVAGFAQSMAQRFADSEIKRFPQAWMLDHGSRLFFGYSQGVGTLAMLKVFEATKDTKYWDYVYQWTDSIVDEKGNIHLYEKDKYNIDFINSGKTLMWVYKKTAEQKYKLAMDDLRDQMKTHPRTSQGAFWHKQIYPYQVWLDGLYMGSPFLAEYAVTFNEPALMEDVVNQFMICHEHNYDAKTGLYHHAWDQSKSQRWCDPATGNSRTYWGRSIGWWFMALVDVLDFVPESHSKRPELIAMIQGLADALPKYQDKTGLWYQVIDQGGREGNYLEASVSSQFMYAYAKALNKGYIDKKYRKIAEKVYKGLTTVLMRTEADGSLTLTQCCAVSGLGGNPYRDGSYEYYIHEKIRDNDAKATGPFIMGCIELGK